MKTRIILSLIIALSIAALGFTSVPSDTTKAAKQKKTTTVKSKAKTVYVCPMDKDVVSSKPGNCPKCGMKLQMKTPVKTEKKPLPIKKESVSYSCPMHQDVVSSKPGKCPKCGMNLEKVAPTEKAD
jgi:predicted lipoprotein with Yx(FWY)xxD motif